MEVLYQHRNLPVRDSRMALESVRRCVQPVLVTFRFNPRFNQILIMLVSNFGQAQLENFNNLIYLRSGKFVETTKVLKRNFFN